jgi:hypothetical protein
MAGPVWAKKRPAMADEAEKECCRRTRERWLRRIEAYYTAFPVIKDVPCDDCREILEIRVYGPAA